MWFGAITGILISVVLGIIFCIVFYVGGTKIWKGNGEYIFKGFNCMIAAALILWLSFAMLKFLVRLAAGDCSHVPAMRPMRPHVM